MPGQLSIEAVWPAGKSLNNCSCHCAYVPSTRALSAGLHEYLSTPRTVVCAKPSLVRAQAPLDRVFATPGWRVVRRVLLIIHIHRTAGVYISWEFAIDESRSPAISAGGACKILGPLSTTQKPHSSNIAEDSRYVGVSPQPTVSPVSMGSSRFAVETPPLATRKCFLTLRLNN
jgi:hypothetical protein